ncbi:MAG: cupin, partial [Pseudomonadota bacterium]
EEGDLINIPTGMFRGFENIGTDYGMIMAVLGGNDAGGGVDWAPQVIEEASDHGLVLGDNGVLYDTRSGQQLPESVVPMPLMPEAQASSLIEPSSFEVASRFVARYWDMVAAADRQPALVLGEEGMLTDKPGFTIEMLTHRSACEDTFVSHRHDILMTMRGHWKIRWSEGEEILAPGDTCAVIPGLEYALMPSMSGEASLFRVRNTDDPAGATHWL